MSKSFLKNITCSPLPNQVSEDAPDLYFPDFYGPDLYFPDYCDSVFYVPVLYVDPVQTYDEFFCAYSEYSMPRKIIRLGIIPCCPSPLDRALLEVVESPEGKDPFPEHVRPPNR